VKFSERGIPGAADDYHIDDNKAPGASRFSEIWQFSGTGITQKEKKMTHLKTFPRISQLHQLAEKNAEDSGNAGGSNYLNFLMSHGLCITDGLSA